MFGATNEQQNEIAREAKAVGGYFELVERRPAAPAAGSTSDKPTYHIDPQTRQVRLVPAG